MARYAKSLNDEGKKVVLQHISEAKSMTFRDMRLLLEKSKGPATAPVTEREGKSFTFVSFCFFHKQMFYLFRGSQKRIRQ
jgi:hypothetical protein